MSTGGNSSSTILLDASTCSKTQHYSQLLQESVSSTRILCVKCYFFSAECSPPISFLSKCSLASFLSSQDIPTHLSLNSLSPTTSNKYKFENITRPGNITLIYVCQYSVKSLIYANRTTVLWNAVRNENLLRTCMSSWSVKKGWSVADSREPCCWTVERIWPWKTRDIGEILDLVWNKNHSIMSWTKKLRQA